MGKLFLYVIKAYRYFISPLLGDRCRFYPSCSEYMAQAITKYGALRGVWIGIKRLSRCHPWCEGGHDPLK